MYPTQIGSTPTSYSPFPDLNTSRIRIDLHGCIDLTISVLPADSISSIQNYTLLQNCQYLCKNLVLCPAMSFAFYDITDGDQIYVQSNETEHSLQYSKKHSSSKPNMSLLRKRFDLKFAPRFKEPDEIFQQIQASIDPETSMESARLSDISKIKIESNPLAFRRVCTRFSNVKSFDDQQFHVPKVPTIIPIKAISPSTDTLPMFSFHLPSADGVHSFPCRSLTPPIPNSNY